MITIDLSDNRIKDCPPGRYIIQFRTSKEDKQAIANAAGMVGMTLTEFIREVMWQATCQVHEGKGDYGRDARSTQP